MHGCIWCSGSLKLQYHKDKAGRVAENEEELSFGQ